MLHPVRVLDHVIEEYRDYLLTEFRAKDPALKEALERELDRPRFLAQEPFFQAHRPFRAGRRWRDLPIDPRLAGVMERRAQSDHAWRHQSDAIERLLGPTAGPLVVTTGTGSGKTEAFLLPVIQRTIEDATRFRHAGLTATISLSASRSTCERRDSPASSRWRATTVGRARRSASACAGPLPTFCSQTT